MRLPLLPQESYDLWVRLHAADLPGQVEFGRSAWSCPPEPWSFRRQV